MRITKYIVLLFCVIIPSLAAEEQRPKKKDERGKRNLEYQTSHHYINPSNYRLERRISTNLQSHQVPAQYFPHPYRKGRPQSYPVPPYAVQMEPLIHYSQRDPLYDTNILSLDKHNDDLLTENNHINQEEAERRGFIRYKTKIIEKPVFIKEPEPIIEIIIKESNISLPAPPPPPPPPKKKKEQVQVFFVKYKKNPNGEYGKDNIIYDKPIPAISPKLPEDSEEEVVEAPYNYHAEEATLPPPPSTTLRTVIRPDSETYHSPSGIKVTFGKEGFDYAKRSSKPDDYVPPSHQQPEGRQLNPSQQATGRQLTSFPNTYFKPPASQHFNAIQGNRPDSRPRQPYRPVSFPSSQSNYKPLARPTSSQYQTNQNSAPQKYSQPQFQHTLSRPPSTGFQNLAPAPHVRQPVPYKPFENYKPQQEFPQSNRVNSYRQQQIQFRPETHFSNQQLPHVQQENKFSQVNNKPPQFSRPQNVPGSFQQPQFSRPHELPGSLSQFPRPQDGLGSLPQTHFARPHEIPSTIQQAQQQYERPIQNIPPIQSSFQNPNPQSYNFQLNQLQTQQAKPLAQQVPDFFQQNTFNQQSSHFQQGNVHQQSFLPPGGELIQSLPKYETHISTVEHPKPAPISNLSPQQYQEKTIQHFNSREQNSKDTESHQSTSQQNLLRDQSRYLGGNQNQQQKQHDQQRQQELQRQYDHQRQQEQQRQQQQENQQQQQIQHQQRFQQQQQIEQQQQRQQDQEKFYLQREGSRQSGNQVEVQISNSSPSTIYQSKPQQYSSTPRMYYQQSTEQSTTTITTTEATTPSTTTKDPKILEAQLPDEVPPELREQLLSSGILNNADISILDYDKVGDIPLSALPPDQLANFFNAGGAQQIAGSEPEGTIVDANGVPVISEKLSTDEDDPLEPEASDIEEVKVSLPSQLPTSTNPQSGVKLKVVQYDPQTEQGKQIQEAYISGEEAKEVSPVILNDESYTRYLPLKVNGTQFPIPDVPELKGRKISSVVVLAPVTYDFNAERKTRQTSKTEKSDIEFIEGTALKDLLANPSLENYKKFLDSENKTASEKQSVILLVTDPQNPSTKDKDIFMYDVSTQTVSKLSGELSSAFVEAAEANSNDDASASASEIVEEKGPYSKDRISRNADVESSDYVEENISFSQVDTSPEKTPSSKG